MSSHNQNISTLSWYTEDKQELFRRISTKLATLAGKLGVENRESPTLLSLHLPQPFLDLVFFVLHSSLDVVFFPCTSGVISINNGWVYVVSYGYGEMVDPIEEGSGSLVRIRGGNPWWK